MVSIPRALSSEIVNCEWILLYLRWVKHCESKWSVMRLFPHSQSQSWASKIVIAHIPKTCWENDLFLQSNLSPSHSLLLLSSPRFLFRSLLDLCVFWFSTVWLFYPIHSCRISSKCCRTFLKSCRISSKSCRISSKSCRISSNSCRISRNQNQSDEIITLYEAL